MSFLNKVVLVTGASSGIGAATAILFSKEGAQVAIVGRNEDKMKNVAEECANVGSKPLSIKADITDDEEARRIVKETIDIFGKLDILVNNAGLVRFASLQDNNILEVHDLVMNTNLRAQVHLTHLATPFLIESKGNIIFVSSVAGLMPAVHWSIMSYHASKAALNNFSQSAALELAPHGVRVNCVSPGPVETDALINAGVDKKISEMDLQLPLGRISKPDEIADLILFLASDKAVAITGSNFISDNGVLLKR